MHHVPRALTLTQMAHAGETQFCFGKVEFRPPSEHGVECAHA